MCSATESPRDLETRLANARAEIEYGTADGNFNKVGTAAWIRHQMNQRSLFVTVWVPQTDGPPKTVLCPLSPCVVQVLVNDSLEEAYLELKALLRTWYPHLPAVAAGP